MAPKTAQEAARAKAEKQKKRLLILILPLGLALFYAYHTVSKLNQSPSATPPAATTSTTSSPSAPSASSASATPGTTTPLPPQTAAPTAPPATKLTSLSLLPSRDPFSASRQSPTIPSVNPVQQKQSSPPPTSAVIALDRTLLRVHLHANFGHAGGAKPQPLFRVVSLTSKTAKISILGKRRQHPYTLQVDAPRVLSGSDGNLYVLMLLPQGTPVPAAVPRTKTASTTTTNGKQGG